MPTLCTACGRRLADSAAFIDRALRVRVGMDAYCYRCSAAAFGSPDRDEERTAGTELSDSLQYLGETMRAVRDSVRWTPGPGLDPVMVDPRENLRRAVPPPMMDAPAEPAERKYDFGDVV